EERSGMTFFDESRIFDQAPSESDGLVNRLRGLAWPAVPAEVRERCWDQFSRRLSGREPERERDDAPGVVSKRNVGRRLDFTRHAPTFAMSYVSSAASAPRWAA